MAIHDYVIDNSTGANVRADINSVLQAILTNNSSSSAPSTTAQYMFWADTTSGTLKIRNSADNAWIELLQLDGTLTLEDGSNSAPALCFRNDLNSGIFSNAADTFNIATGGVERIGISSTEVVVNQTGASVDFRIEGDTEANLFFVDASVDRIGIGSSTPGSLLSLVGANATVTGISLGQGVSTLTSSRYIGICQNGNENNLALNSGFQGVEFGGPGSANEGYIAFHTHNVGVRSCEIGRISKTGKVGIGTTTPNSLLDCRGADTSVTGISLALASTDVTHSKYIGITNVSNGADITANSGFQGIEFGGPGSANEGYLAFHTHNAGVSSAERARIDKDGKVGINENTPATLLHLRGSDTAYGGVGNSTTACGAKIRVQDTAGRVIEIVSPGSAAEAGIGSITNHNMTFFVSNTEKARMMSLNLNDPAFLIGTSTNSLGSSSFGIALFYDGFLSASRNVDASNGVTYFGGTSGSATVLGDGDLENTNGRYTQLSDIKYKENVVDANSQWDDIKAIKVRNFNFKSSTGWSTHKQIGIVAQELELTSPALVKTSYDRKNTESHKSVAQSIVYMKALKALQEAMAKIEVLETKVAALEAG